MKGVLAGERNEGIEEKEEGVLIYVLILLLPLPIFTYYLPGCFSLFVFFDLEEAKREVGGLRRCSFHG